MAKKPTSPKQARSYRFTATELKQLDRLSERFGGDKTRTIIEGLNALEGKNEPSNEDLVAMIKRRLS